MPSLLRRFAGPCIACAAFGTLPAHAAITFGQIDTFEETPAGWGVGDGNPNPPAVQPDGGPLGDGDGYLRIASVGGVGPGSRMAMFNTAQWAGDYLGAGVDEIDLRVRNLGTTDLDVRLLLRNDSNGTSLVTGVVHLDAGGDWTHARFSLRADDVSGSAYAAVMHGVTALNLLHAPNAITARSQSPAIAGVLGVDNIAAVPEPAENALLAAGLATLALGVGLRRRITDRPA